MKLYDIIQRSERATATIAYRLKHGMEKKARLSNHLTFLIRCRNHQIVPRGLTVKLPTSISNTSNIASKASFALLRRVIRNTRSKKVWISEEIDTYSKQLREVLTDHQWQQVKEWCKTAASKVARESKARQINKYNRLYWQKYGRGVNPDKVVHNASDRTLTEDEKRVLSLGLNFAVTPKTIPTKNIIAATESTARRVDSQTAEKLRANVSRILQTSSPPQCNLPGPLRKAVKNLRTDDTIVILPADKGNATVVMNRRDYDGKIETMLEDGTYKRLVKDPTAKIERKIDTTLKQVEKKGEIPRQKRLHLTPHSSAPPQLYGLPKVHKAGTPLRPIVSAIDSPTYKLSKEIATILSPLAGHTSSFVKDSADFARRI